MSHVDACPCPICMPPRFWDRVHVGQLWKVNGITYRIDSLRGEDVQYPIVMAEAARDPRVNAELDAMCAADPDRAQYLQRSYEPRNMTVEARWFDRKDVKQVA